MNKFIAKILCDELAKTNIPNNTLDNLYNVLCSIEDKQQYNGKTIISNLIDELQDNLLV